MPERRRKNPRLREFDYRAPGPYYVTICTYERVPILGRIVDGEMRLNPAGSMVQGAWQDISLTWSEVVVDAFVVMPNHVHGVLFVDADTVESNARLGQVVGWFKTVTTNRYIHGVRKSGWPPFDDHVWQRNYYEHVVRNDADLERVRTYIEHNPAMWHDDSLYVP